MSDRPPFWHPSTLIATCFGLGYAPKAPGTAGAGATALVLAMFTPWPRMHSLSWQWVALACPIVYFGGVWASRRYMAAVRAHDPGAIVIDEVLGMMVAWLVATFLARMVMRVWTFVLGSMLTLGGLTGGEIQFYSRPAWLLEPATITLGAFLLFRLYDIWKPGLVGRLDRESEGPQGVMLDDVAAGLFAGLTWFALTVATLALWMVFVWAQPKTGWQQSGSHSHTVLQASGRVDHR